MSRAEPRVLLRGEGTRAASPRRASAPTSLCWAASRVSTAFKEQFLNTLAGIAKVEPADPASFLYSGSRQLPVTMPGGRKQSALVEFPPCPLDHVSRIPPFERLFPGDVWR